MKGEEKAKEKLLAQAARAVRVVTGERRVWKVWEKLAEYLRVFCSVGKFDKKNLYLTYDFSKTLWATLAAEALAQHWRESSVLQVGTKPRQDAKVVYL